jgi:transposase
VAKERLAMRNIYALLQQRLEKNKSPREIARSLGVGRTTVQDYIRRAANAGLTEWLQVESLSEAELEIKLGFKRPAEFGLSPLRKENALPDFVYIHRELSRPDVTLSLLWTEYREGHGGSGYGYTQFVEHYNRFALKLSVVMRQRHLAGEKTFVDYCEGLWLQCPATGECVQTQLFVGCLGASSYTFAEVTMSQTLPDWLMSHVRMFEFFGGVTAVTVPDNLKSGVNKPCFYEPTLNESYRDLGSHYGTVIIPAGVRKPRHKAKVEAGVLVAQRWILARLRDHIFTDLFAMNEAIAECLLILNPRKMRHLNKSRLELFEELDKPALKALPEVRYEYAEWKVARVNIDYHIMFDHHHYSVPYQLAHQAVDVRATGAVIEIFYRGKRITSHRRSFKHGGFTTNVEHMPRAHRARAEWSPSRVINWAGEIGFSVKLLVEKILETKKHPEQGYRAALGIIRLEKKYGRARVEVAAKRALELGAHSYKFVAEMLKNKMDNPERFDETSMKAEKIDVNTNEEQLALLGAENLRGSEYYH